MLYRYTQYNTIIDPIYFIQLYIFQLSEIKDSYMKKVVFKEGLKRQLDFNRREQHGKRWQKIRSGKAQ